MRNGTAQVLGRDQTSAWASETFITPDGRLWTATNGTLSLFQSNRWQRVGTADESFVELFALGTEGPPWFLRDDSEGRLFRLTVGSGEMDTKLELVGLKEDGSALSISDGVDWVKGVLLLATTKGLRTYEMASGKLAPAPLPALERDILVLARDRLGRLWLGGQGLAMVETGSKTVHTFDTLPVPGVRKVTALAADQAHGDGVIAALGAQGVVFVRAAARAN
jgi:hypothetical protein